MSWGRGISNNLPGELRMPSVPEYAAAKKNAENQPSVTLIVRDESYLPEDLQDASSNCVYISESSHEAFLVLQRRKDTGEAFVYCHSHPHFVLRIATDPNLPTDAIVLTEVQRENSHVCTDEPYTWLLYDAETELPVADLTLEVRPRFPPSHSVEADGRVLANSLAKSLFGLVVTLNELFVLTYEDIELVSRVIDVTQEVDESEEGGEGDLNIADHFRGRVDSETRVWVIIDEVARLKFHVKDITLKPEQPRPKDIVDVTTGDDEYFPVKAKLLRPCIALTSAVMAGRGVHEDAVRKVHVQVDCCTFDRVLLYLEASAKGKPFDIEPGNLDDMSQAASELGLSGLEDLCAKKRGAFLSRVRRDPIPFSEVTRRNTSGGEVLLTMDGMVLDVTRWLQEHPGGSTIIPEQALNMDSTVFFEIYHASRLSFLYLKEFYIGELSDPECVPRPSGEASIAFLETLRVHTPWRLTPDEATPFKSF